jgi:hypothetical protein
MKRQIHRSARPPTTHAQLGAAMVEYILLIAGAVLMAAAAQFHLGILSNSFEGAFESALRGGGTVETSIPVPVGGGAGPLPPTPTPTPKP